MDDFLKFLFATSNKDKVKDLNIQLEELGIKLFPPPKKFSVQENKSNLLENAKLKAKTYSQHYSDQLIFASDGGVKIPYLGKDWNHVLTKRLSGKDMDENYSDRKRCEVLLKMMENAQDEKRKVYWHEAFAIAWKNKTVYSFETKSPPGYLLEKIPGSFEETGFWIGYLWFKPEFNKTYMQLTDNEKRKAETVGKKLKENLKDSLTKLKKYKPLS